MYYTYLWLREDGTPYYIGKGKGDRAYDRWGYICKPPPMDRMVFYIAKDEAEAFENEIALIWYYGRKDLGTGCLRNLTDGGENPPKGNRKGQKGPPAWNKGLKPSVETLAKASATRKRNNKKRAPFTAEHRRKISEARKGMVFTEEHIQNLRTSHKGKPSLNKGRHPSDAVRLKMSLSQTGKKHSKETKRKMSGRIPWNYLGRSPEEKQAVKIAAGAKYRAKKKLKN